MWVPQQLLAALYKLAEMEFSGMARATIFG
jgi:hypothetical protein